MMLKQFVIRKRRNGRGTDYGIVTDNPLDVFAKCVEIGLPNTEAEQLTEWSKRARFGTSSRPLVMMSCKSSTTISIECRDPGREAIVEVKPKKKRGRKKKGEADVG